MPSRKPTKAQLITELAQVTQERDDAWIALTAAQRTITAYETQRSQPSRFPPRPQPRLVELVREATPQGDRLRVGDTVYQATITARGDGAGYQVVAPVPNGKPLVTSLSPAGVGHLPEHAVLKLLKA